MITHNDAIDRQWDVIADPWYFSIVSKLIEILHKQSNEEGG